MVSVNGQEWKLKLPALYPEQYAAVFAPERISVIEASTKAGKTVGCITWQLSRAWNDDKTHLWVAPIYKQTTIAYERLKRFLVKTDPNHDCWTPNESKLSVKLASGATLVYRSGDDPNSIYGADYADAVIDEATRCKEEVWYAVRSTLTATRGPVRIIGNVKGRKNWAYHMARKAQSGAPDMAYFKITAHDAVRAGVLSADEIDGARRELPDDVFRELYLAEPTEDGGNPFGIPAIRALIIPQLAPGPVAHWGIDIAGKKGENNDWTVAIGLNAQGHVCAYQRWQSNLHETGARLKAMVKYTPGCIDATGVGLGTAEEVKRECPNLELVTITKPEKEKLMGHLAYAIHNRQTAYPERIERLNGSAEQCQIVPELESFEYEVKVVDGRVTNVVWSAPPGLHDDCVTALALAVMCRATAPQPCTLTGMRGGREPVDTFATGYEALEDERMWDNVGQEEFEPTW